MLFVIVCERIIPLIMMTWRHRGWSTSCEVRNLCTHAHNCFRLAKNDRRIV